MGAGACCVGAYCAHKNCGCGAKEPVPLNDEEKQYTCNIGCKEMSIITCAHAIKNFDQIVIKPPDVVNNFRDNAKRLRDGGEEIKEKLKDMVDGDVVGDVGKKVASGGMLGGLVGAAAAVADKALDVAAEGAGKAFNLACHTFAEAMDKFVEEIEKPFTECGQEIVKVKHKEITDIMIKYINDYTFQNAFALVREKGPNAISDNLTRAMVGPLAKQLLPIVQEEIDKHVVTKLWDAAIEQTNAMIEKMQATVPDLMEKYGPKPIKLDINIFIVTGSITEICRIMGEKEKSVRANPVGQSRKPKLFEACFSDVVLCDIHMEDENAK